MAHVPLTRVQASGERPSFNGIGAPIPWQERPAGCRDVVWRHAARIRSLAGITCRACRACITARSAALRRWLRRRVPVREAVPVSAPARRLERRRARLADRTGADSVCAKGDPKSAADYAYDPRLCEIDGTYYITWCGGHNGPTISVASTRDFQIFERMENAFLPFNRNGVLFPRKIDGKYFMLSRPSDDGHTPFGDIYLSQSPDMCHWGMHRLVMRRGGSDVGQWWQRTKIGAGPDSDRNRRRLADDLSRRDGYVQRVRLQHGRGAFGSRRAVEGAVSHNQHILTPERGLRSVRARAERRVPVCGPGG